MPCQPSFRIGTAGYGMASLAFVRRSCALPPASAALHTAERTQSFAAWVRRTVCGLHPHTTHTHSSSLFVAGNYVVSAAQAVGRIVLFARAAPHDGFVRSRATHTRTHASHAFLLSLRHRYAVPAAWAIGRVGSFARAAPPDEFVRSHARCVSSHSFILVCFLLQVCAVRHWGIAVPSA